MFEIDLKLRNKTAFTTISGIFPDVSIFRWCNSAVDYLEFYGKQVQLEKVDSELNNFADQLGSRVVHKSLNNDRLSVMFSCRCSVDNSTIRLVESRNCLWKAPVVYRDGYENIMITALKASEFESLYSELEERGDVEVQKKVNLEPDSLRDVYLIPVSAILGDLTDRQLLGLRSAIERGFFTSPRRVSIEELSILAGISKSTMQEHVNKALNKLINSMNPYVNLMLEFRNKHEMESSG